ncbi:POTRA domain-containing protein [Runella sp.]|uniref:M56 family metallopeptidase n=1 Tax=Runella sp. TaxID=1960881 RepID=UPI003D149468
MINSFFIYLAESTICLLLFTLIFRLLLSKITYFQWNRCYLLSSVSLALIIPLISPSIWFYGNQPEIIKVFHWNLSPAVWQTKNQFLSSSQLSEKTQDSNQLIFLFTAIYLSGFIYKLWFFLKNLRIIMSLIHQSEKTQEESCYSVYIQTALPTFSFMRYIFLEDEMRQLKQEELLQVIHHEQVHVRQKHTIDLLLFEVVSIVFWFNPTINYLKKSLKLIHEYLVDADIIRYHDLKEYSHLLLKLALRQNNLPMANGISNNQLLNRIMMLTQPKSGQIQKLRFLMAIPALSLTIVSCSFLGDKNNNLPTVAEKIETKHTVTDKKLPVRKITWIGNTLYTDTELDQALSLKKGNIYNEKDIRNRIDDFSPGSVSNLYMDKGYLFFVSSLKSKTINNELDIEITIAEGEKVLINDIILMGNKKISKEDVIKQIAIHKGEFFNRTKLINSMSALAKSGYFDPEKINITPLPTQTPKGWIVDIQFVVEEK